MEQNKSYLEQLPAITDDFVVEVVEQINAVPINAGRKELSRINAILDDIEFKEFKKAANAKIKEIHLERQSKLQPIREAYDRLRERVLDKEHAEKEARRDKLIETFPEVDVNELLTMFPTLLNKSTTKAQVNNFVDKYKEIKDQEKQIEELKKSNTTNITNSKPVRSVNDIYIDVLGYVNDNLRDDVRSVKIDENQIILLVKE